MIVGYSVRRGSSTLYLVIHLNIAFNGFGDFKFDNLINASPVYIRAAPAQPNSTRIINIGNMTGEDMSILIAFLSFILPPTKILLNPPAIVLRQWVNCERMNEYTRYGCDYKPLNHC